MRLAARALPVLVSAAMVLAACGAEGDRAASGSGDPSDSSASPPPTDPPGGRLALCQSPEGFRIAAPEAWAANPGDVLPPCSQWNPRPFQVPEASDARVAAITAAIDDVPFSRVVSREVEDRAATSVSGRRAVRLSYTTDDGLFPTGTAITLYAVDLTNRAGDAATLLLDTVDLEGFDYDRNVVVLDRMARTLEITAPDVDTEHARIASPLEGGERASPMVDVRDGELCLRIPPEESWQCADAPASSEVTTVKRRDVDDPLAGFAGKRVWRVDLQGADGGTTSQLPVPVPGSDARAFAFSGVGTEGGRLLLRDSTGAEIARRDVASTAGGEGSS